jgi:hypothetical protein
MSRVIVLHTLTYLQLQKSNVTILVLHKLSLISENEDLINPIEKISLLREIIC